MKEQLEVTLKLHVEVSTQKVVKIKAHKRNINGKTVKVRSHYRRIRGPTRGKARKNMNILLYLRLIFIAVR